MWVAFFRARCQLLIEMRRYILIFHPDDSSPLLLLPLRTTFMVLDQMLHFTLSAFLKGSTFVRRKSTSSHCWFITSWWRKSHLCLFQQSSHAGKKSLIASVGTILRSEQMLLWLQVLVIVQYYNFLVYSSCPAEVSHLNCLYVLNRAVNHKLLLSH